MYIITIIVASGFMQAGNYAVVNLFTWRMSTMPSILRHCQHTLNISHKNLAKMEAESIYMYIQPTVSMYKQRFSLCVMLVSFPWKACANLKHIFYFTNFSYGTFPLQITQNTS